MKYRILAVIVILITFFSLCVNAVGYEYSIAPSDNFIYAKHGDDLTQVAEKLNMTTDELNTYFNQNELIYLAVSDDNKSQIKLSVYQDGFSSVVSDISQLSDADLNEFANSFDENGNNIVMNNGRKFIRVKHTRADSGGTYTVTQYITICNNKTFYFAGYNDGENTSKEITAAFESFKLSEIKTEPKNDDIYPIIINVGVVVFGIIAIVMIIGIIKLKIKALKESNEVEI